MRLPEPGNEGRSDTALAPDDIVMMPDRARFWRDIAASWGVVILLMVGIAVGVAFDHVVKVDDNPLAWHVPVARDGGARDGGGPTDRFLEAHPDDRAD